MPPRTVLTQRQKRLGSELRRMRTAAGMSAEYAAGLLGVDRSRISNMESGQRGINAERLRKLACNCDCTDETYVEALVEMAEPSQAGWWERYRGSLPQGLLDISETEAYAVRLRGANTVHVPGLLQTPEHAMAIFRAVVPQLPEHEVALRLAHRTERQSMITRDDPVPYVAVIHEAALRMQFGGRDVARGQLKYLLEVSEWDHVTVLVIPFDHGAFPGAGQTVVYAEGPVRQLDTVQIDNSHGPDFLYAEGQLAKYRAQLDLLEGLALSPERSRDFIREIAHHL
ncbi:MULTISPECIES: Scr1 family TA system antitoxin-like transcriptional regulator [Streptomyces]|uniref:Helix-turn-helix transcriptional regulator n=1 Tax=Streptomyces thermocarboxydus TaxID=59299 RepID=A0ABU3JDU2_9ACTN|nr:helix-turn-helix transcriptional regulator [Streptomyces sp. McG8]MDT6973224.1 helix-turn-helix transcriptional regulator [Streptomyces thermocarboxydus]MXQ57541.1 helix-turn-helix domain-containing protein [Streptomyces sp. XHT-2]MYQ29642.1 helix-turn-helix domain-containing protein [Streptomyces sp. SID4956]WSB86648.1 helix-turn-helix transcriptional regulator [Streptomyces cellulosae]